MDIDHALLLEGLTEAGALDRFGSPVPNEIVERLEHELDIINEAGFPSYFLIVHDIMSWARMQEIPVGPGRGSVCGSLVAYVLRITDVNPLEFDIPFERFLHLERVAQPDIDLDICQQRRGEVISYIRERYGEESVAQIVTFGTMMAKGAIRDACRVLHVDDWLYERNRIDHKPHGNETGERIAGLIDEGSGADQPELRQYEDDPNIGGFLKDITVEQGGVEYNVWDVALTLEGLNRHTSSHAAGVVIADRPLVDAGIPLYRKNQQSDIQIQYDYKDAEKVGLLKMDLLGLRTVTVLGEAVRLVRDVHGQPDFSLDSIPMNDKDTFRLLQRGDTVGVFQLEGEGITAATRNLKPQKFWDIIVLLALYRPGPIEQLGTYADRLHGREEPQYLHDDLRPALERTYGLMVFQEQVMNVVRMMGGYTAGEADMFRKAIGKKEVELIESEIAQFKERAVERGYDADLVEEIGAQIYTFGRYGFNLGHATGYGYITYWTAYLKANYPDAFYTAMLNSYLGNSERIGIMLADMEHRGIEVTTPDINESGEGFTLVEPDKIRFGLLAVKGVGENAVTDILEMRDSDERWEYGTERVERRKEDGTKYKANVRTKDRVPNEPRPYEDLHDFCQRLTHIPITAKRSLVTAGAFGIEDRPLLMETADEINKTAKKGKRYDVTEYDGGLPTKREIMQEERDALGFYVTSHPLQAVKKELRRYGVRLEGTFDGMVNNRRRWIYTAGMVMDWRTHQAKNGEMAWVSVEGSIDGLPEITVFADHWADLKPQIEKGAVIVVNGKIDHHPKFGYSIVATNVHVVDPVRPLAPEIYVHVPDADFGTLAALAADDAVGRVGSKLYVVVDSGDRAALVNTKTRLRLSGAVIQRLEDAGCRVLYGPLTSAPWDFDEDLHYEEVKDPFDGHGGGVWDLPEVDRCVSIFEGTVAAEWRTI